MATTFRTAGYYSLYSGKPKNFNAACHAFDETFNPGGSGPLTMGLEEQQKIRRRYADTVISFLAKPERKTKPFFVFYAPLNPHDPLFPETDCSTWYQGDKTPKLPPNSAVDHQAWAGFYQLDTACRTYAAPAVGKGQFLPPFDLTLWPKVIGEYYAQVSSFDREIGRMLDALESNGQLKNTIIILSSDNGLALTDHGLMHKSSLYEHDIKLPMLISGPGIPENKRSDAFVYVSDMFPTMCELTGIPIPSSVQMKSFRPSILDPQKPNRKSMYFIYSEEMRAFRDEQYKIILYHNHRVQLYDLKADPQEVHDLSNDPAHAERLKNMIVQAAEAGKAWEDGPDRTKSLHARAKNQPDLGIFWNRWATMESQKAGEKK
jgi:arylsulfatase A-like enzyme